MAYISTASFIQHMDLALCIMEEHSHTQRKGRGLIYMQNFIINVASSPCSAVKKKHSLKFSSAVTVMTQ